MYRNVAAMVDPPRVAKRDLSPWSADEARRFLFATRWTPLYAAYVLALGLGLRRGEVLGLYWSDVDPEDRTLRVRRQLQRVGRDLRIAPEPKSHRRVVPLPSICVVCAALASTGVRARLRGHRGAAGVHDQSRNADRASELQSESQHRYPSRWPPAGAVA